MSVFCQRVTTATTDMYSDPLSNPLPLKMKNRLRSSRALSSQFNRKVDNILSVSAVWWTQRLEMGCREMDELYQREREGQNYVKQSIYQTSRRRDVHSHIFTLHILIWTRKCPVRPGHDWPLICHTVLIKWMANANATATIPASYPMGTRITRKSNKNLISHKESSVKIKDCNKA